MMHQNGSVSRRAAVTGFGALGLGFLGLEQATADDSRGVEEKCVEAHIYPYELKPGDTLSGGGRKKFKIKEQTLLIWVKFFSSDEYVLISKSGTRVETAEGEPVLNGNPLFRFFPLGNPVVVSPIILARTSPGGSHFPTTDS